MGVRLNYAANYSGLFTIESNHFQSRISDIFTQMRFHEKLPKLFYCCEHFHVKEMSFRITSVFSYLIAKKNWPQCVYYTVAQVCIVVCHLQQLKAHWRIWHVTNKKCRLLGVAKNSGKHCSKLLSYISKKAPRDFWSFFNLQFFIFF